MWFVLSRMGLKDRWIKICVMCARVSMLVNGSLGVEFKMERGLR